MLAPCNGAVGSGGEGGGLLERDAPGEHSGAVSCCGNEPVVGDMGGADEGVERSLEAVVISDDGR